MFVYFCSKRFYLKYLVTGNECLSCCCKSDEMLSLCSVWKLHCPAFQITKSCGVSNYHLVNELAVNMNSKEYFDWRKNIRKNTEFLLWRLTVHSPVFQKSKNRNSDIYKLMVKTFILTFIHNHLYIKKNLL